MREQADFVVVGAGISGLAAARALKPGRQTSVVVLEAADQVGGSLATTRIGRAVFDSGVPYLPASTGAFGAELNRLLASGDIEPWGDHRYRGRRGMADVAAKLAHGLDVRTSAPVKSVRYSNGPSWEVVLGNGDSIETPAVVLAIAIPQSLEILRAGGVVLPGPIEHELEAVTYEPTLGALLVLEGPSGVGPEGLVEPNEECPFAAVYDNHIKGISPLSCLTIHGTAEYSKRRWDHPENIVLADLVMDAEPFLGGSRVIESRLVRWPFHNTVDPWPDRTCLLDVDGAYMALAGGAFGPNTVDGAYRSGHGAAQALKSLG